MSQEEIFNPNEEYTIHMDEIARSNDPSIFKVTLSSPSHPIATNYLMVTSILKWCTYLGADLIHIKQEREILLSNLQECIAVQNSALVSFSRS